ncbi:MAG: polyprenol monophosphomannose synthase [Polyangiales bacterium]
MAAKSLIITPTYNEADNLSAFVESLARACPTAHLLVVDDASPDGTAGLATRLSAQHPQMHLLQRSQKLGIGSAYLDGFAWALARDYAFIFQMDTDLSHDPCHLPAMHAALQQGADVVLGSRNIPGGRIEGWGPGRHFLSKGGSLYSRCILGLGVRDLTSGYKGFRRNVLQALALGAVFSEGYAFQIELTYRALRQGFRVVEVPITFADRRAGQSKMSGAIFREAVSNVWRLRWAALRGRL